jgi:5'-3' exoribonuclease 2
VINQSALARRTNSTGEAPVKDPNVVEKAKPVDPKPFIFLDVSVLREYLEVELKVPSVPFPFNQELAIDDWIFMIFFVGNDFLPHLPSLEILFSKSGRLSYPEWEVT